MPERGSKLFIKAWGLILLVWLAGACALLSPLGGNQPVEDKTSTSAAAVNTATQTLPIPSPTPEPTLTPEIEPAVLRSKSYSEQSADGGFIVLLQYPYIEAGLSEGFAEFNQQVEGIVFGELETFRKQIDEQSLTPAESVGPSSFLSAYEVANATQGILSLRLNFDQYASGAAHPYPYTVTLTYDFEKQKALSLADLFLPDSEYLQRLSDLALADLSQREWFDSAQGLAPLEQNYPNWLLTEDGLTIIFDVYQVAPYAAGPQLVEISFDQLQGLLSAGGWQQQLSSPAMQVETRSLPIQLPPMEPEH